jgi:hypothetical protein
LAKNDGLEKTCISETYRASQPLELVLNHKA